MFNKMADISIAIVTYQNKVEVLSQTVYSVLATTLDIADVYYR